MSHIADGGVLAHGSAGVQVVPAGVFAGRQELAIPAGVEEHCGLR